MGLRNVDKSHNNDFVSMRKKFTSLQLSQNRQLRRAYSALDQLLHGILIFVSAIAQQGECVMKT